MHDCFDIFILLSATTLLAFALVDLAVWALDDFYRRR